MNQQHNEFEDDHDAGSAVDDRGRLAGSAITIGDRLRLSREALGLTRARLAAITGISASTLKGYESGKRTNPRTSSLSGFAKARINVQWLLGDESAPMLLDSVEKAEKTADYVAGLLGDEEAQKRADAVDQKQLERLTRSTELVHKVTAEIGFTPGTAVMASLIMSVCLHGVKEEAVRDLVKAIMAQAALDARSRT